MEKAASVAEAGKLTPWWLADTHFLLGEAFQGSAKDKAIEHYKRFLQLAPPDNPYRVDATRALKAMGVVL